MTKEVYHENLAHDFKPAGTPGSPAQVAMFPILL